MLKFFGQNKQTNLVTEVQFIHTIGGSTNTYQPCSTTKEFSGVLKAIKHNIEREHAFLYEVKEKEFSAGRAIEFKEVKILVSGKLKGKDFNQTFSDLTSYQAFLRNQSLIKSNLDENLSVSSASKKSVK